MHIENTFFQIGRKISNREKEEEELKRLEGIGVLGREKFREELKGEGN